MKSVMWKILLVMAVFGLAACGTTGQPGDGTEVDGFAGGEGATGQAMADLLAERTVYFDFDSSSLDPQTRNIIKAHAAHLNANPDIKVALEGHCDERGTREYNLALGERRAKAVSQLMRALGISSNRVSTVSYGEEKPVALGHNEGAWRQNRRVEINY